MIGCTRPGPAAFTNLEGNPSTPQEDEGHSSLIASFTHDSVISLISNTGACGFRSMSGSFEAVIFFLKIFLLMLDHHILQTVQDIHLTYLGRARNV